MGRWQLHLAVVGVLFLFVALVGLADLAGGGFLRGIFVARRPPTTIEGRKLELKRWWMHNLSGSAGTVYAEVQADFQGTLNLLRFSATAAGQPALQQRSEGQYYVPVRRGQTVILALGYSRSGAATPDSFVLSLQLQSELTGRGEVVNYATDFASRKSTDFQANRPIPPPSEDRQAAPVQQLPPLSGVASPGKPEFDSSALDGQQLQAYVAARRGAVQQCYEREQRRSAVGSGNVSLRFTITPAGRASGIEIEENTLGNEAVARCLQTTLRGWVFPIKPDTDVSVLYPFHFEPVGGAPFVQEPPPAPGRLVY